MQEALQNNAIFRYNFLMMLWEVAFSHFQRISTLFFNFYYSESR